LTAGTVVGAVGGASSLESAAHRASDTGRKVAMSLIALGFAMAAIVLVFKRDFKEAAGVLVVGMIAILLITPAGVNLLKDTVASLVGGH
jgi:FtsH-binding integral membrane protein